MIKTLATDRFAVFDNVFSPDEFREIAQFTREEPMSFIHSKEWRRIFRIGDGHSLEGPSYTSKSIHSKVAFFPTGREIDILFRKIRELAASLEPWVGKENVDWDYFSAKTYLYPRETGLSWHDDFTGVSGAYIFYFHPEWRAAWGGELLIAEESPRISAEAPEINERILHQGAGNYVCPKPNRLVMIRRGVSHTIKKVDPDAGENARCSVSGFFMKNA